MESLVGRLYSFMGVFALVQTFLPPSVRQWLERTLDALWEKVFQTEDANVEVEVEETMGGCNYNVLYRQVCIYLSSLRSAMDKHARLKVSRSDESSNLSFSLPDDEALEDSFDGARVQWTHTCSTKEKEKGTDTSDSAKRRFTLQFLKAQRGLIMPAYLDHVCTVAAEIEHRNAQRHLTQTEFNHPSTFNTLALEADLADRIKADLEAFSKGEQFYHRNGRAWKRGYLLYSPPGTGKSSMIAAIANHLKFDIYDLELTKVHENAVLKSLLMQTTRKSIIVIEDIDCTVQLQDRTTAEKTPDTTSDESGPAPPDGGNRLTLSGLLNFTDGLWSCCGEERIFIFTTNHKDRLDPALLRPGRMDMHILLSYCTFPALKKMAINYLGIQDHHMYLELEGVMARTPHQLTPAAIAELLISNQNDPDAAIKQVMAACCQGTSEDSANCKVVQATSKRHRRIRAFFVFGSMKSKHV